MKHFFSLLLILFFTISALGQNSLGDLNVILKCDFENNTLGNYLTSEYREDWNAVLGSNRRCSIERDGEDTENPSKVLRISFPANSLGPSEGGTQWHSMLGKIYNEIYLSYDIYFMPGFQYQLGGKLPSLQAGVIEGGGDFNRPSGFDGFTGGMMFGVDGKLKFYPYFADSYQDVYGDTYVWGNKYSETNCCEPSKIEFPYTSGKIAYVTPGKWHNITYRMVSNTVYTSGSTTRGNYDGILEAYFDGVLVTQASNILFRHTDKIGIDRFRMVTFFGGSTDEWRNPIDEWLQVDNVIMYTFKDTENVPKGNILSPTNRTINYWRMFSTLATNPPAAPTALTISSLTKSSIGLKWTDNAANEQGFRIYRSTTSTGTFTEIGAVKANITTFSDNSLSLGTTYYYKVLAYNEIGASNATPELSASTLNTPNSPLAPSDLRATLTYDTSVLLAWTDNSSNETHFEIERTGPGNNNNRKFKISANSTNFTDSGLDPNSTYEYKISACDLVQCSFYSEGVSISTPGSTLAPYEIQSVTSPCILSDYFYVPVVKTPVDTLKDCIGFDMVMTYDKNKVMPTGIVQVKQDLVADISLTDYYIGIHDTSISISLYLNAGDPSGARFRGTGQVLAVEFIKTSNFRIGDTTLFTIPSLIESYATNTISRPAQPGTLAVLSDSSFVGSLRFWSDNNPLGFERINKDSTILTHIYGFDPVENTKSGIPVQPDPSGNFEYYIRNGNFIQIERDIPDGTDVMQVINGIDAQMLRKVLVEDTSFIPNIYQIIAMDVNMDGIISAGDNTQINERIMSLKGDYQQAWNYDAMGVSNGLPSRDWVFVPNNMLSYGENFRISKNYPRDDHQGYSRGRVPVIPNCLPLPVEDFGNCQKIGNEGYKAVLLGDVDGNYKHISNINKLKSTTPGTDDGAILDLSSAVIHENTIDIPVSIHTDNPVYSLDFALKVNTDKIKFHSVVDPGEYLQWQAYFNEKDKTLRLTSNSLQPYDSDKSLLSLRFALISGEIEPSGIIPATAYLNGEPENFMIKGNLVTTISENPNPENIKIYPNPANSFLFINAPAEASVNLLDITGRLIYTKTAISEDNTYRLDVQDLNSGIYLVKIEDGNLTIVKKVIIRH